VLVKASAKQVDEVMQALRGLDGVVEASVVYGETDVICRIAVASQSELDRLVMRELHAIEAVESTRTFVVVGDMHWRR
jgi:DNA-binding Lrp family transcriptional regulator